MRTLLWTRESRVGGTTWKCRMFGANVVSVHSLEASVGCF